VKTEKVMATFAAILITLSMVGVAYAAWYDTVTIKAEVHMGELIVGWLDTYCLLETTNGFPEDEAGHGFEPKPWVANTTVDFFLPETSVHHDPNVTVYKLLYVLVENAYPQYDVHLKAFLKNAGTIPACLIPDFKLVFRDIKDNQDLTFTITAQGFNGTCHYVRGHIDDPVVGPIINFDLMLCIPDPDMQMEPCTAYDVYIDIDFKQEAEECHTYTFAVDMVAIQWNKLYMADQYKP
jgi:hypothetical protein